MNDGKDGAQKKQMDLVMARAEASRCVRLSRDANKTFTDGTWGESASRSMRLAGAERTTPRLSGYSPIIRAERTFLTWTLWLPRRRPPLMSALPCRYTFVREWYQLRDCLAGCIGGMLSIATTNLKLHVSVPERRWFRIRKVAGVPNAIVSSDGKDVDIDLGELRFGEKREMLVEVEMCSVRGSSPPSDGQHPFQGSTDSTRTKSKQSYSTATDEFFLRSTGLNPLSLDDSSFYEDEWDGLIDECPLFEVQASFRDPVAGKFVSRLPYPVLLTISVTPPIDENKREPPLVSDPAIVRRRMECLVADMLLRSLLLMSRHNGTQAHRLLSETKRIVSTILAGLPAMTGHGRTGSKGQKSTQQLLAHSVLVACLEDVDALIEGMQAQEGMFDSTLRNFATQQAVVLRDQHAWTPRTPTERVFWSADVSLYLVQRSGQWI
jgi:hypothetical protein